MSRANLIPLTPLVIQDLVAILVILDSNDLTNAVVKDIFKVKIR